MHDPAIYPDPYVFDPERYLRRSDDGVNPDPRNFAFGYGRRSVARLPSTFNSVRFCTADFG